MNDRIRLVILTVVLLAAVAGVYHQSLDAVFIHDDNAGVLDNPHVRSLTPLRRALTAPRDTPPAGRPLVALTLAINYAIGEYRPAGYHAFNLAVHLLNAALLLLVIRSALRLREQLTQTSADVLAWIIALLWAVHPLASDAVVYVSQRTELLASTFLLLTLYASLAYWKNARLIWPVLASLAAVLGVLCKEWMFAAPVIVWLFDAIFVSGGYLAALRRHRLLYAGLCVCWIVLTIIIMQGHRASATLTGAITPWQYLLTQSAVIAHYLRLVFWPDVLLISYDWPIATGVSDVLPAGLIVVMLLTLTVAGLVRRHPLGFLGAVCFLVLAPSSSVVPIVTEVVAERRMYVPLAALLVILVMVGHALLSRSRATTAAGLAVAIVLVIMFSIRTDSRVSDYRNEVLLWQQMLAAYPDSVEAHNNLGTALVRARQRDLAMIHFQRAIEIEPNYVRALGNLAAIDHERGRLEQARLRYEHVLRIQPRFTNARRNLAALTAEQGQLTEAISLYETVLRENPEDAIAIDALGVLHARQGRMDEAERLFLRAIAIHPTLADPHNNIGRILLQRGEMDAAIAAFARAIELRPSFVTPYMNLALALARQKRFDAALQHAQTAVTLNPANAEAVNNLGVVLAQMGQIAAARDAFARAVELQPGHEQAKQNLQMAEQHLNPPAGQ